MAGTMKPFELKTIKVVAVDLDGVVYQGKTMIEGADEAIHKLRRNGLKVFFTTNSSIKTRADIVNKLIGMGISTMKDEVLTSAYMAGLLIKSIGINKKAFIIGADGLKEEIINIGATVVTEPPCDIVFIGMDTSFTYEKIRQAMEAIMGGAIFVACNRDANFPSDHGHLFPGCGPIVAAVEAAVGLPPKYIVGKPGTFMLDVIAKRYRVSPDEILVVGDGIDSDIKMAISYGSPSVLIDLNPKKYSTRKHGPTFIIGSLAELPVLLKG